VRPDDDSVSISVTHSDYDCIKEPQLASSIDIYGQSTIFQRLLLLHDACDVWETWAMYSENKDAFNKSPKHQ
jgi:hypothetical protein